MGIQISMKILPILNHRQEEEIIKMDKEHRLLEYQLLKKDFDIKYQDSLSKS